MTLQSQLDTLRETLPACKSAAFGDLSAQLILRSSTDGTCAREVLDEACRNAKAVFDAVALTPVPDGLDAATFARSAILFDAEDTQLIARHDAGSEDVVLIKMGGGQPIADALPKMTHLADQLAGSSQ